MNTYYTIPELAQELGLHRYTLWQMCKAGKIEHIQPGGTRHTILIPAVEADRLRQHYLADQLGIKADWVYDTQRGG